MDTDPSGVAFFLGQVKTCPYGMDLVEFGGQVQTCPYTHRVQPFEKLKNQCEKPPNDKTENCDCD